MSNVRLLELINREPAESARQIVLVVQGEKPITIEAGRSVNLTVDSTLVVWIGRKVPTDVIDLPPDIAAIVERDAAPIDGSEGDTAAPTGDETAFDPYAPAEHVIIEVNPAPSALDIEAMLRAEREHNLQLEHDLILTGKAFYTIDSEGEAKRIDPADVLAERPDSDYPRPMPDAPPPAEPLVPHTREELEAMSFGTLRNLAEALGIKGRAKAELVREILAATANAPAVPEAK
jgi:hypothetical protein